MFNRARAFLATICIAIVAIAAGARDNKPADAHPLKIGIIGAARIGGTLATLWVKAGHEVLVSSRHPDELPTERNRNVSSCRPRARTRGRNDGLCSTLGGTEERSRPCRGGASVSVSPASERPGAQCDEERTAIISPRPPVRTAWYSLVQVCIRVRFPRPPPILSFDDAVRPYQPRTTARRPSPLAWSA